MLATCIKLCVSIKLNIDSDYYFQPLLDIVIYVQKLTGAIGIQVWCIVNKF